jgi:serine/threonine-protein kinase
MKSPAQPDPWIGRSIGDRQRYRLEGRLGSGGMGEVFLAMDTLIGKQVALKLLKDKLVGSTALRKRFEREVAICAALKGDHIVNASDYGITVEGYPFYVMEYLRGQSLKQLLEKQQRLDVKRTVNIITQVCEGLRLAHAGVTLWWNGATASEHVKVVHRDLKPDNIFLVPTSLGELVKILDFGIAKIRDNSVEQTNITRAFIGTFRFAAPEQLSVAKNLDERADIYTLGIILYEMLTGTDPFGFGSKAQGVTGMQWAMAHRAKPPMPLRLQPDCEHLSPQLEAVVMRCLQKSPDDRFASVDELNRALQAAVMSGEESEDTTVNPWLDSTRQEVSDVTIVKTSSPSGQNSNDTTFHKPSTPTKQEVPQATIAETLPPLRQKEETPISPLSSSRQKDIKATSSSPIRTPSTKRSRRVPKNLFFLLGAGIGIGLTVLLGTITYVYIQSQLKTQVLDEIKTLRTKAKYEACIAKAQTVARDSNLYDDAQRLLNECQVEYAKQLAAGNNFTEAIATAKKIPQNSPLYSQAQALIKEWSEI